MRVKPFQIKIFPPDSRPHQCTCFLCGQKTTRAYLFTGPGKDYLQYIDEIDPVHLTRFNEKDGWEPPILFETCADCPPTAENFNQRLIARMVAKELEG
jgi:hypothetical protein